MASVTVKLPEEARAKLAEMAREDDKPMSGLLADLIATEHRRRFWDEFNASFARLRADPEAWADYQAEIASMEGTLLDGLEDDPWEE